MALDAVTEKIAHFIGAFEMLTEEARMRAEYDKFRAIKKAEKDAEIAELGSAKFNSKYKLKDVDGKLKYKPLPPEPTKGAPTYEKQIKLSEIEPHNNPIPIAQQDGIATPISTPVENVTYNLPLPSSVAVVAAQLNNLTDNDVFGGVTTVGAAFISSVVAAVAEVAETILSIGPIQIDLVATSGSWYEVVTAVQTAAASNAVLENDNFSVDIFLGEETVNQITNGEVVEEAPEFEELLPVALQKDLAAASDDADPQDSHDFEQDFGSDRSDALEGQTVVAGQNTLINTTVISSAWLDADKIVVGGDYIHFDAIAQTNVVIDQDYVAPALADIAGEEANETVSIAQIKQGPDQSEEDAEPSEVEETASNIPTDYVIVRLEGDVVQTNWIEQHNFTDDNDQASIILEGTETYLTFGENQSTNTVDLFEIGFEYDLIVVAGDYVELNLINQVNILLDSDVVVENEEPTATTSNGVELSGSADDGQSEDGDDLAGVDVNLPSDQTPEDPVEEIAALDSVPTEVPPISTSDNLLYNEATIHHNAEETVSATTEEFAEVLEDFAAGDETLSDDVQSNEAFDGASLLRVLYVDGDFTTVNTIDQVNVLGDADQVHLARDDFAADLQEEATVTTGSNVLGNVAEINDNGIDTDIQVDGDTYSDELIYQAELIETTAPADASQIAELATEAVAFLADDLIEPDLAQSISNQTDSMIADVFGQHDIMQSVLV